MSWGRHTLAVILACGMTALAASAHLTSPSGTTVSPPAAAHGRRPDPWVNTADLLFKVAARDDAIPNAGLPRAVAQDGDGFVWIATDAGLSRWDGTEFRTYTAQAMPGSGALPEPMVNHVFSDQTGLLWLGMSSEGLLWHDPDTDRFTRPPNRTALDHAHILTISSDGNDGLWVGSDIGLSHVRRRDHVATAVPVGPTNGPLARNVQAIHLGCGGVLWVARGAMLYRRRPVDTTFLPVALQGLPADDIITALHEDGTGRLWIATGKSGFYSLDRQAGGRHFPIVVDGRTPKLGMIIEAGNGTLWASSRAGIWIIDPASTQVRRLAHDPLIPGSLPEDGLNALTRDRAGLIWTVGDSSLAYVDPTPRRVLSIVSALRSRPTEQPHAAWSVGAAPDGTIWYGAADTPAFRLTPARDGRAAYVKRLPGARRDVEAFAFSAQGGSAFTASDEGLFALSLAGTNARRLSTRPWSRLLRDGDTLYAGGNGVAVLDVRHPGTPIPTRWSAALTDHRVRSMAFTTDRALWIGTAHGLNRIDLATDTVSQIHPSPGQAPGLKANYVSTLLGDRQGRLWAGTVGGGITIFARDARGWHPFRHLGRAEGLPHDTIDKLLSGPDGAIWVSTDGGIARIDPVRLTITTLRASEGVAFIANWTGGGDTLPDGRLLFAGFGGLTLIDPRAPPRNQGDAPLRFTAITSGAASFAGVAGSDLLTIGKDQRSLTAEFAKLDYVGSREQDYAYRLFPLETEWTRVDALHRVARYTNLPPGRSTLVVRAVAPVPGSGLHAVGAPLTLGLEVERRWYETLLFRVSAIVGLLLVVLALYHLRMRTTRRRQRALENLVQDRTAKLLASQSELEKFAYTDTLTGLGNRRLYGDVLTRHVEGANHKPFALFLIDLDRFKRINDALGHDVGDALLIEVADRLTDTIRRRDSIFRLGGDEFAIILAGIAGERAIADLCRRLYDAFARPVSIGHHSVQAALSIGTVIGNDDTVSKETLYKLADVALYEAKRAGRGTWRLSTTATR